MKDNISELYDTLDILKRGEYRKGDRTIRLKLSEGDMQKSLVFLPDKLGRIKYSRIPGRMILGGRCRYRCRNTDSFSAAIDLYKDLKRLTAGKAKPEVLVLNFANPVNPGGGVRIGAKAQEEDLCRHSSLLPALEGKDAVGYYEYNRNLKTPLGSDAIVITPKVEIIKDENGRLLDGSVVVAVMTCAAPVFTYGLCGLTEEEYRRLFYRRIYGMLECACFLGYEALVLGAFGCGAFGNDANVVSDIFYKALKDFEFCGMREKDAFRMIDFAVLDRSRELYNYRRFCRNFDNFYRDEDIARKKYAEEKIKISEKYLDRIRGSIFGGAVGDALGYPVEFMSARRIFERYGEKGITSYRLSASGKALISDDTQMSLFTAVGVLFGETRRSMRGIGAAPSYYVARAYLDWLTTQEREYRRVFAERQKPQKSEPMISWLMDLPRLYSPRAPGATCISALEDLRREGVKSADFIENPKNDSKGCGGIMRIAPFALHYNTPDTRKLDMEAARIAAITHGHSLGYMPAAVLAHILNRLLYKEDDKSLKEIIFEARDAVAVLFEKDSHLKELCDIIDLAVKLSENDREDNENIPLLGQGWVAEETLAIALYCSLRHRDDFSAGITAAVNHDGDSDSTGSVTGNILGLIHGYWGIDEKWKKYLEIKDVILEIADDICHGCIMSEYFHYNDPAWTRKYIECRRPEY